MQAQNQKVVNSLLEEVTVFFTGAELTHIAKVNLSAGENEVLVEGFSPHVDLIVLRLKQPDRLLSLLSNSRLIIFLLPASLQHRLRH